MENSPKPHNYTVRYLNLSNYGYFMIIGFILFFFIFLAILQDDYPVNKFLNKTDFSVYQEVILDGVGNVQKPPKWMVYDNGREIVQTVNG